MSKVFGIGLGRTGTRSLAHAMAELGYSVKHSPKYVDELKQYDFINDIFVAARYKFLDYYFEDAKFILTVRSLESWMNSSRRHGEGRGGQQTGKGVRRIPLRRAENRYLVYGICHYEEELFRRVFVEFNDEVLNYFRGREEKLLVLNICEGEGWGKLCNFLDRPIPKNDFPHRNKGVLDE